MDFMPLVTNIMALSKIFRPKRQKPLFRKVPRKPQNSRKPEKSQKTEGPSEDCKSKKRPQISQKVAKV